jgi:hypothetical protein
VPEVVLDGSGIVAVVGQLVAGGMPQHVAVDKEREAGGLASSSYHALIPGNAQGRQALGYEDIDRPHTPRRLPLQPAQGPQLLAADRMDAGLPALGALEAEARHHDARSRRIRRCLTASPRPRPRDCLTAATPRNAIIPRRRSGSFRR